MSVILMQMMYTSPIAPGDDSDAYPSDITISNLDDGDEVEITLYWWATEVGTHTVTLSVDPSMNYDDPILRQLIQFRL